MKIIHTSDWHLGHLLYGYPQDDQQKVMLDQMVELVKEHKPDAFLISGDVYDTTQPSASVQTMLSDALVEIHKANPSMQIVCIAGNHDSGARHMIFHSPWKALNVTMLGGINKGDDLNDYIVKIDGVGYVAAVPFAADRFMPEDIYVKLSDMIAKLNEKENLPVALMAHLAISCDFTGHEQSTEDNIGGLNCVTTDVFGKGYDYVALGHIHKQQIVNKDERVRYCGTPIAVSFDESTPGNDHGALLVECDSHGGEVKVTHLHIDNPKPLVNIPATGVGEWKDVLDEFKRFPQDQDAFIRLNVEVEDYLPGGAQDEAKSVAGSKKCTFCIINTTRKEKKSEDGSSSSVESFGVSEFKNLHPADVAKMYLRSIGIDDSHDKDLEEFIQIARETKDIEDEE